MKNDDYKFIFIHIPKTGGTSIESALCRKEPDHRKHISFSQYESELGSGIKSYFVFSVVRNPWDRMVSYWKYRQGKKQAPIDGKLSDFTDWINFVFSLDLNNLTNKVRKKNIPFFRAAIDTQFNFLKNKQGCIGLDVIKFENLQNDFNKICKKINIDQLSLPHKNKTKHKHYTEYYDDETREIVAKRYKKDIEIFNYSFDA